ncbi:MAG: glycosyltransferase family 4 protein [Anaeromyxobacteraceae bacterium]
MLADCQHTAAYLREARLRPDRALEVLPDCVDTRRFRPGPPRGEVVARLGLPDPSRHVVILTLGRLVAAAAHKGYERLLDAFARAAPRMPELRLVFAGGGALGAALRARAGALGIVDRVTFTGPIREDDLVEVYRACDVFSLVSDRGPRRGEGLPLAPLEAAACGKPVLVGDQDGSREAADHGETGYVLDPFDLDGHAARLVQLARDPALRARLGEAGLARVRERHDYPVFRRTLARHLERLERQGARRRRFAS